MRTTSTSFRLRLLLALVLTAAVVGAQPQGLAAEDECEVDRDDGTTRDCTWSEEFGKCELESIESWQECIEGDGEGFWGEVKDAVRWAGCSVALGFDGLHCVLEGGGEMLL